MREHWVIESSDSPPTIAVNSIFSSQIYYINPYTALLGYFTKLWESDLSITLRSLLLPNFNCLFNPGHTIQPWALKFWLSISHIITIINLMKTYIKYHFFNFRKIVFDELIPFSHFSLNFSVNYKTIMRKPRGVSNVI